MRRFRSRMSTSVEGRAGSSARPFSPQRKRAKGRGKLVDGAGMPGAGLTVMSVGQARPDRLALKPYWGKPDVRNFREGDGNVGIIRSPVRAIALPDHQELVNNRAYMPTANPAAG